jgi:YVTN family beta-propeller protein
VTAVLLGVLLSGVAPVGSAHGRAVAPHPGAGSVSTVTVGQAPGQVVYDSGNGYVYVANSGSNSVSVINDTTVVATVAVGSSPDGLTYDPANGFVYVSNGLSSNVTVINGTSVVASVPAGIYPKPSAYDSANGWIYVPNNASNNVTVINGTSVVGSIAVGHFPVAASYDPKNGFVYVSNYLASSVSVINGSSVQATVPLTGGPPTPDPLATVYDGANGFMYVMDQGYTTITVLNGTSTVANVNVGWYPQGAAFDPANGYMYVPNTASNNVSVIDGTRVVGSVPTGTRPMAAAFDGGNGYIYVANFGSDNVTVINGTHAAQTIAVGGEPSNLAYDASSGNVYVTNTFTSNVSVIPTPPAALYSMTFHASGLAAGTVWAVTVDGVRATSSSATIRFAESNGTHAFTIAPVPGYTQDLTSGTATVRGSNWTVNVSFSLVSYAITFTESGLPSGDSWSVTLSGSTVGGAGTSIGFSEPNGTYLYVIGTPNGTSPSPRSGSVTVLGTDVSVDVTIAPVVYSVLFRQSGLPTGTPWSVTLGGITRSSSTPTVSFLEANGTYDFTVGTVAGWSPAPTTGVVHLAGQAFSVIVVWTPAAQFSVTFLESGLAGGTPWSATLNGSTASGSGSSIAFTVAPGMYAYTVPPVPGYTGSGSGTVSVVASNLTIPVAFQREPVMINLTFRAAGLAAGANWSVTLTALSPGLTIETPTSVTRWSAGADTVRFLVSPGNYTYAFATAASGYRGAPGTVGITVGSSPVDVTVTFVATTPAGGPPAAPNYVGEVLWASLGAVVVGALAMAAALYRSRRRELHRGQRLVARIGEIEWESGEGGEPIARTYP